MKVEGQHYRTVWAEGKVHESPVVKMIDQRKIPFEFEIFTSNSVPETRSAIKDMVVRGAGAIATGAGFGMVQGVATKDWNAARELLETSRPTAINLKHATTRVYNAASKDSANSIVAARIEAESIANEDIEACRKIGEYGAELIKDGMTMMTQCNAGWLAFTDIGSALAPVWQAKEQGKNINVITNYTHPRGQGAKLTAWELNQMGIPHMIAEDTEVATLMARGKVNLVITGADRIAANGDTANKIGTMGVAMLARQFGIPFYIAAPTATIDFDCLSGEGIPIEERSEEEVIYAIGKSDDGRLERVLVASPGSHAYNYSFDVTPARFIKGIITEKGIIKPKDIIRLKFAT